LTGRRLRYTSKSPVLGLALALFGAALVLNIVSLRELAEQTRIGPAIVGCDR